MDRLLNDLGNSWSWPTVVAIVVIAVVAVVAWYLVRLGAERVAAHLLERARNAEASALPQVELERRVRTVQHLAVRITGTVIAVIAVLTALLKVGIDIGPAIAGLGVVGIAVGLGAQTLIRDWLAGIFIVLENQYNIGDIVQIAGVSGAVEDFSLRRTMLRDISGAVHTVPNGQIVVASNLTRTWARVNLDIPVAHGTDLDAATAAINAIGEQLAGEPEWGPRFLEPPTVVRVDAVSDQGVTLKVLGQVRAAEQWAVADELRKRILAAFEERGIRSPVSRMVMDAGAGNGPRPAAPAAPDEATGD